MTDMPNPPPLPSPERLQTLLFDAARGGRDDVIPALLQAGADLEARDPHTFTALVLASYNDRPSTTALLLDAGAAPDGTGEERVNTALMGVAFKGYLAIARLLLDRGADVNRTNGVGQTALMMAALFGQTAIVDLLIERGADRHVQDANGNTASTLALAQGNVAMAERLT